jgi:hypothetical protein
MLKAGDLTKEEFKDSSEMIKYAYSLFHHHGHLGYGDGPHAEEE